MRRVFTSTKNRSQTAFNHLGSLRLDLNTATERGRDRDYERELLNTERLRFGSSSTNDDEEKMLT